LRAKRQFLPANTERERILFIEWHAHVAKQLVHVKLITVGRARPAVTPVLQSAFELCEDTEVFADVCVGMNQVTLEHVTVVVLRASAPVEIVKVFVALTHLAAEREP